jgi:hypothetical protein
MAVGWEDEHFELGSADCEFVLLEYLRKLPPAIVRYFAIPLVH